MMLCAVSFLKAEQPDWVSKIPFTDDAFWGSGYGESPEVARKRAKLDILMQLSSHVKAVVAIKNRSDVPQDAQGEAEERLDGFFENNKLRGAELVDEYVDEDGDKDRHWALMKYGDACGKMLMSSAVIRYEKEFSYDRQNVIEKLSDTSVEDAIKIRRRLSELELEEYTSEYINVVPKDTGLKIVLLNFLPDKALLSEAQKRGLSTLSATLFEELGELPIKAIEVIGHANPTGAPDEEAELLELSRNRAETMSKYLSESGFTVNRITWKGGEETVGDVATVKGMGKNRRVEIIITLLQ